MTTGEVSGRMFLKKHKEEYSGDLLLQFISASATSALGMTCHQLRAEFGMYLATNFKRRHFFVVDNLDPEQLLLFRTFLATYRLSHQDYDSTIPPHLFQNITLCLELNDDVRQSITTYHKTLVRYNGHGIVPEAFDDYQKIEVRSKGSRHGSRNSTGHRRVTREEINHFAVNGLRGISGNSTGRRMATREGIDHFAVNELRGMYDGHLCSGPDKVAVKTVMDYMMGSTGRFRTSYDSDSD